MTELDLNDEYPWPRKGDDPFAVGSDSRFIACLNFTHDQPWGGYAEGFKMLGNLGVAQIEKTAFDQDFLVYSIAFCYRHYIELSLKLIIRAARQLLDEQGSVPTTHNLADLWNTAEPLWKRIEPRSQTTYADVRTCLAKFSAMDPGSETFRYPVTADGAPTLPTEIYHLDLRQLRDVVERLSGFLDAAGEQALVYLDDKAEMASYYVRRLLNVRERAAGLAVEGIQQKLTN